MKFLCIIAVALAANGQTDYRAVFQDLGGGTFKTREAAGHQLVMWAATDAGGVLSNCWREFRLNPDPEVKARLHRVMRTVVEQHLFRAPRGFLGIQMQSNIIVAGGGRIIMNGFEYTGTGIWVGNVVEGGAAAAAGLKANDVILDVNGRNFGSTNVPAFTAFIQSHRPGTKVKLNVVRTGATNPVEITLGELPETERERLLTTEKAEDYFNEWIKQQPVIVPAP